MKVDMLLDSFETLKDDYDENYRQLKDIIVMMFDLDEEIGLRLWKQLINDNIYHLKSPSDLLSGYPFAEIKKIKGIEFCINLIKTDEFIKESLFLNNGNYTYSNYDVFVYLADHKDYKFLYELLLLTQRNKYCNENIFEKALFSIIRAREINLQTNKTDYFSEELTNFVYQISNECLAGVNKAKFDIELLYRLNEIDKRKKNVR